jgi:hypothetical protein
MLNQLLEIEESIKKLKIQTRSIPIVNKEDEDVSRDDQQSALARTQPSLDFTIRDKQIVFTYQVNFFVFC